LELNLSNNSSLKKEEAREGAIISLNSLNNNNPPLNLMDTEDHSVRNNVS